MSEPTARWQELCNQAQEARQTFDRLCEQLLAELHAAESVRPADSKENLQETLWQMVEMVAITDSTHGNGVGFDDLPLSYVCPFCLESLSRFAVRNGESFPHAPACIVTKARALMSEREAQPQIKAKIEKPMVSEKEIDKIVERLSRSGYNVSITQDGRSILIRVSKMVDGTVYVSERYVAGEGLAYIRKRLLLEMCEEKMETLRQSIARGW